MMNSYADNMFSHGMMPEKRERFIDFIRKILHTYQMNKNMFTPYAPDVYFDNIKQRTLWSID